LNLSYDHFSSLHSIESAYFLGAKKQATFSGGNSLTDARVGVAFSSGFFGFFAHAGFLAAQRELGILPSVYAGASSVGFCRLYMQGPVPGPLSLQWPHAA